MKITLCTGGLAPLGPNGAMSGIAKVPIDVATWLGAAGLEGDVQGDRRVHGGPEKAVLHYAFDHYTVWRSEIGDDWPPLRKGQGASGSAGLLVGHSLYRQPLDVRSLPAPYNLLNSPKSVKRMKESKCVTDSLRRQAPLVECRTEHHSNRESFGSR